MGMRGDGDGWVRCAAGHRHWGRFGAAGLLLLDRQHRVLLQHRTAFSHHGGTWGLPGGALNSGESARAGALREAGEEASVPADAVAVTAQSTVEHGGWSYTTVLATAVRDVEPVVGDWESEELRWVPAAEVAAMDLHPGLAASWPVLHAHLGPLTLVVDAANVMGSRPDGWWRDRAGAAARLRDRLSTVDTMSGRLLGVPVDPATAVWSFQPSVVLVVEGKARGVAAVPGVEVIAAPADGDSTILEVAHARAAEGPTVVVTADRELRSLVHAVGAATLGPATLLGALENA